VRYQEAVFILIILSNFYMLAISRISEVIRAAGFQGILLASMLYFFHEHISLASGAIAVLTAVIKGLTIPTLLLRAVRNVNIRREDDPVLGFAASLIVGAIGTGAVVLFAGKLPLIPGSYSWLLIPACFSTVLTGFILLITRRLAISQVIGFLALENGVFIFGLLLINAVPFLVEVGVLLDLLVAVFIMGIMLNHIQRTFSSLDTVRMSTLKDG